MAEERIELEILGLSSSQSQSGSFALVLGEVDGNRRLPIIIGMFEAQAIAIEIEKIIPNRPMTHDLFKSFAHNYNIIIQEVYISDLKERVFFAKIICEQDGNIIEILCTYDPETRSGSDQSGRKVKGTIHWVSAEHAVPVEVRNYDRLFAVENPNKTKDGQTFLDHLNPDSLSIVEGLAEPEIQNATIGDRFQFERLGYYVVDPDTTKEKLVFNRIVPLRDSWGKMVAKGKTN